MSNVYNAVYKYKGKSFIALTSQFSSVQFNVLYSSIRIYYANDYCTYILYYHYMRILYIGRPHGLLE